MADKYGAEQDPYCYNHTNVLKNNFNIQDENILSNAEREITTAALKSIHFSLPPYDLAYFKNINYHLFSRIYNWAGKLRSIDISKNETHFCIVDRIEPEADKLFKTLKKHHYFVALSDKEFIEYIAQLYGDINMLHPFREGNGRTQRILFDHIALNAAYTINWSVSTEQKWKEANIHAVECDYEALQAIFRLGLKKIQT
ncbi:MAG: cell filamentation protein Fic [Methyloprofundus sp.]|nr:cell filamentation protein Fic [Methyloprofundus sp.]